MNNVLQQSKKWKENANKILENSKVENILKKFGELIYTGSYAADLMMGGDIDIYVVNKKFSKKIVLEIFNKIANFCSYQGLLFFDWKKNKHPNFPSAYYIGLKTKDQNTKWKIDIWFLENKDLQNIRYTDLDKITLSREQKFAILTFKEYRNKFFQNISSIVIYDAVITEGILDLDKFKKYIKDKF